MQPSLSRSDSSRAADEVLAELVEEFTTRLQAGEALGVEAFALQHPEHEAELRRLLPALAALADIGHVTHPIRRGPPPEPEPHPGLLGDFRIVREVGRGGMGVVYEAEQISLRRRVALKVLPFASVLDARLLQRFHTEALAAAQLHHSNIVPVFAVGSERGVHYYAMQFIEGQTVEAVVRAWRGSADLSNASAPVPVPTEVPGVTTAAGFTPTTATATVPEGDFRSAARLARQAALGLDYAHQQGIVHRDIKPANLIVDGRGNLWITDFGLARIRDADGLTRTGDILGTLRYMSPEQARGRRPAVDHRTDVYSLGLTLYEMLTLRPAFPSNDQQELLRQILQDDPRPPRRINRAIPVELETIVLKATAKNPEERYATAAELADDLGRFLSDQPIVARPPTLWDKTRKWLRRHPSAVWAGAVCVTVAVVALAVSAVLIARQRDEAVRRGQQARRAVDTMYTRFAERILALQPHMELAQRDFLLEALRFYEEFARENGHDPSARCAAGTAWRNVADIQHRLGQIPEAAEAYTEALARLVPLAAEFPAEASYQEELAQTYTQYGNFLRRTGAHLPAELAYRAAMVLYGRLSEEYPAEIRYRVGRAGLHNNLGLLLGDLDRQDDAAREYEQGMKLLEALTAEQPDRVNYRADLGYVHHNLANLRRGQGRLDEAERDYRRALDLLNEVVRDAPTVPVYRQARASNRICLAELLAATGRTHEAETAFRTALGVLGRLAEDFPRVPAYRQTLADCLQSLASLLAATGRLEPARELFEKLLILRRSLAAEFPAHGGYRNALLQAHYQHGCLLNGLARHADAQAAFHEALALWTKSSEGQPDGERRPQQGDGHFALALLLQATGQAARAEAVHHEALRIRRRLVEVQPKAAERHQSLADSLHAMGQLLVADGRFAEAETHLREALALRERFVEARPEVFAGQQQLADSLGELARLLFDTGREDLALEQLRKEEVLRRRLAARFPDMPVQRLELAACLCRTGRTLLQQPDDPQKADGKKLLQESARLLESLTTSYPGYGEASLRLAETLSALAECHADDSTQVEPLRRRAVSLLGADDPKKAGLPGRRRTLAHARFRLAELLVLRGRQDEARTEAREAVALLEGLTTELPEVAAYRQELAWFLAACPVPGVADPQRAVSLARGACEAAPEQARCWNTLGLAHHRAGDDAAAACALEKAVSLRGDNAFDGFILAMVYARMGQREQAESWFARADAWMTEHRPCQEDLLRFRTEAGEGLRSP